MMKRNCLSFSLIMLVSTPFLHADSENRLFYDAVRAEGEGRFGFSNRILREFGKNCSFGELARELGKLYFKKEMWGQSILHYRKALVLDPDNRDLSENLSFARETAPTSVIELGYLLRLFSPLFRQHLVNCRKRILLGRPSDRKYPFLLPS